MDINFGVSIAAIAGFLLSLCLAIREITKSHMQIKIPCSEVRSYSTDGSIICYINCIIANASACTLSITSTELIGRKKSKYAMTFEDHQIIGFSSGSGEKTKFSEVRSSICPINLNPYESVRVCLCFDLPPEGKDDLQLSLIENFPLRKATDTGNSSWPFRMKVVTSKKTITIHETANVCSVYDTIEKTRRAIHFGTGIGNS